MADTQFESFEFPLNQSELTVTPAKLPNSALVGVSGLVSIDALQHDQQLILHLNGDRSQNYQSYAIDVAPFIHGDTPRQATTGLIIGYTGWGSNADIIFDVVLSVAAGNIRSLTGRYSTAHANGNQYVSTCGGRYNDFNAPIRTFTIGLSGGGTFRNAGKLSVRALA